MAEVTELLAITNSVSKSEPAWALYAGPRVVEIPDGSSQRRWGEDITVVRSDTLAHYVVDRGPADLYQDIPPLFVPVLLEECVGWLMEMAERHRRDDRWLKHQQEVAAESTLLMDAIRQIEVNREVIDNRSKFGPAYKVQRGQYPKSVALRRLLERHQDETGNIPFRQRS